MPHPIHQSSLKNYAFKRMFKESQSPKRYIPQVVVVTITYSYCF